MGKDQRIQELRNTISELTPAEAHKKQQEGAVLIDVREPDEIAAGSPTDAQRIVRGFLELRVEDVVPDKHTPVLVMCAGGVRSLFAAEGLKLLGYEDVSSVTGGFNGWKNDQLPVEVPAVLDADGRERYGRHLSMPEIGESGQLRLGESRVLLIGAGGLGCPVAYYLAAAGVGHLGLVDDDVVDRSNLQRQILHTDDRVGHSKVKSAKQTLLGLNPTIDVEGFETRLTSSNVEEIFEGWDIVVDGSDNFPTRYLVNDACVRLGIPNVHGSIYRFEGQVSVFWPACSERRGPCYRCLYPQPPPPGMAPSCAEAGVLGGLPGGIGVLQAIETIKILLGIGDSLVGRLIQYDALRQRFTELKLRPDPKCKYCAEGAEFPGYIDYEQFCTQPLSAAPRS